MVTQSPSVHVAPGRVEPATKFTPQVAEHVPPDGVGLLAQLKVVPGTLGLPAHSASSIAVETCRRLEGRHFVKLGCDPHKAWQATCMLQ